MNRSTSPIIRSKQAANKCQRLPSIIGTQQVNLTYNGVKYYLSSCSVMPQEQIFVTERRLALIIFKENPYNNTITFINLQQEARMFQINPNSQIGQQQEMQNYLDRDCQMVDINSVSGLHVFQDQLSSLYIYFSKSYSATLRLVFKTQNLTQQWKNLLNRSFSALKCKSSDTFQDKQLRESNTNKKSESFQNTQTKRNKQILDLIYSVGLNSAQLADKLRERQNQIIKFYQAQIQRMKNSIDKTKDYFNQQMNQPEQNEAKYIELFRRKMKIQEQKAINIYQLQTSKKLVRTKEQQIMKISQSLEKSQQDKRILNQIKNQYELRLSKFAQRQKTQKSDKNELQIKIQKLMQNSKQSQAKNAGNRQQIEQLKTKYKSLLTKIDQQRKQYDTKLILNFQQNQRLTLQIRNYQDKLISLSNQAQIYKQTNQKQNAIHMAQIKNKDQLNQLLNQKIQELENNNSSLKIIIESHIKENQMQVTQISKLNAMIIQYQQEQSNLQIKCINANTLLSQLQDRYTKLQSVKQTQEQDLRLSKKKIGDMTKQQLKLQKQIESNKLIIQNYKAQANNNYIKINQFKETVNKLQISNEQLKKQYQSQIKQLTTNINSLQSNIKQLQTEAAQLQNKNKNLNLSLKQQKQQRQYLSTKLKQANTNYQSLDKKYKNLQTQKDIVDKKLASSNKAIEQLNFETKKLKNQIISLKQNIENLQKQILKKDIYIKNLSVVNQNLQVKSQKYQDDIQQLNRHIYSQKQQHQRQIAAIQEEVTIAKQQILCLQRIKQNLEKKCFLHIFQGRVLHTYLQQRRFLSRQIERYLNKQISYTKLIYAYDPINKENYHKYIDQHDNICVVIRLKNGRLISGFSVSAVSQKTVANQGGILLSLSERKIFKLYEGKRSVTYDNFFLIFGNSQLRLKHGEMKFFTNFGIANSFFDPNGQKYTVLSGEGANREEEVEFYQIFEVLFQQH